MHSALAHLLNTRYDDVIAIVPDEAVVDLCGEVLELVVREMADAYRNMVIVEGDNVHHNRRVVQMARDNGKTRTRSRSQASDGRLECDNAHK